MREVFNAKEIRKSSSSAFQSSGLSLPLPYENKALQGRDLTGRAFFELGYRRNSLIYALINLRCIALQCSHFKAKENEKIVEDCDMLRLLRRPNPWQSGKEFLAQLELNLCLGGQAFWYKVRDSSGVVREIYNYNSSQITPVAGSQIPIESYKYDIGYGTPKRLETIDVVRFTYAPHDYDHFTRVVSPLSPLATLIDTDSEAAALQLSLVMRGAVPASLIMLPPKVDPNDPAIIKPYTQSELMEYKQFYETQFGGANRGSNMISPPGGDVKVIGFDPKKMMAIDFSIIPETRACEALDVPLQMTSFHSSKAAKTYANYKEARLSFYQDKMMPHGNRLEDSINMGFEDEMFRDRQEVQIEFDWSKALALQEALGERMKTLYEENGATLDEARESNGLSPSENKDYGGKYLFELVAGGKETVADTTGTDIQ